MPNLTDFAKSDKPKMSFKKGTRAFNKRRKVAEAMAKDKPDMPLDKKFKIATSVVKKTY